LSQKRNFFAEFFGENIFKIITSVPGVKGKVAVDYAMLKRCYEKYLGAFGKKYENKLR
jgi:hypothetical protein